MQLAAVAHAQSPPITQPQTPPGATAPAASSLPSRSSADAVSRANTEVVVTLVRTTMVGLQQANFSGNYSVLRDIAAPDFQAKNSAADLARIFTNLRELKVDLGAAVLLDPQISRAELTAEKKLYVVGALETKPVPVTFEMLFQLIAGYWRVYGISITPVETLAKRPDAAVPDQPLSAAQSPSPGLKKRASAGRAQETTPATVAPPNGAR
jgi:hypothetical protein